jgi:hypothetical protein
MTEHDYNRLTAMHRNISFTNEELDFLLLMTHTYVDKNARVCRTCSSSVYEFKSKIYSWFSQNQQAIYEQIIKEKTQTK